MVAVVQAGLSHHWAWGCLLVGHRVCRGKLAAADFQGVWCGRVLVSHGENMLVEMGLAQ
jgi:hypothetical protein